MTYKSIDDIPCARYIGGAKAIKVHGDWAYAQHPDGMSIYHYHKADKLWHLYSQTICTNC